MMTYLSGPVTKIKAQEFDWVSLKVSTTYRTMLAKRDFHFSAINSKSPKVGNFAISRTYLQFQIENQTVRQSVLFITPCLPPCGLHFTVPPI